MTTAIKTNGVGKQCDTHLNLTKTLADAWAEERKRPEFKPTYWYPHNATNRAPFAGKDTR